MRLKIALSLAVVLILLCAIAGLSEKQPNSATSVTTEASSNSTVEVTVSEEPEESVDTSTESDTIEISSEPEEVIPPTSEAPDDEVSEESVEEIIIPDIITTLEVKLYNDTSAGFNLIDGRKYIEDIISYLKLYAPEGMFYSAASAMAYTEGGSGKSGVYTATNNCFGIRAYSSWDGYVYARSTGKVYKDYQTAVQCGASDFFRAYDSMEDSVKDYIKLISGDYYCAALETETPADYLAYVLSKGYGEAELHNMWLGVINIYDLTQYDME